MRKLFLFLVASAMLAGGILSAQSLNVDPDFFEDIVDAMEDAKTCPGEVDNCESGGERCIYYYDNKNYNIETKKNKRG